MQLTIVNARLASGDLVNLAIEGGQIASIGRDAGVRETAQFDALGGLMIPAYIDTHIHLDKALSREQLDEHDGSLAGAISASLAAKRTATVDEIRARAKAVIRSSAIAGVTRLRSHVDVDTVGRLVPLQGVMAAARDCAYFAEVKTIAFPQEGILRDPGTADLMRQAMEAGADVVGGMPHWELTEDDQREHVKICFDLAAEFDADVDMHVDETDDASAHTLAMVIAETVARGWQGRVTAGHVCALAAADQEYADKVMADAAGAGVTVVANPLTNLVLQGREDKGLIRRGTTRVNELRAAGVNVAFGQDCVSDAFYPFGRGDMLEVALISAHVAHMTTRDELLGALDAVTYAPARAWRLGDTYGLARGARADLAIYAAPTWAEVMRLQEPPTHVFHSGRVVARNTVNHEILG